MSQKNQSKKNKGAAIWVGTSQISASYFNNEKELDPETIAEMVRNGGAKAIRNLAMNCIVLPMIENGTGISPEYRAVLNQLNTLATKKPHWFHEDMWIKSFQLIIDNLIAGGDAAHELIDSNQDSNQQGKQPDSLKALTQQPVVQQPVVQQPVVQQPVVPQANYSQQGQGDEDYMRQKQAFDNFS